ncbi:hypothetical protein GQ600_16129 [Phytophthora cactorum]|nr:hypothetical protein GQ600_16129 [Phytophthora cactorum]
MDDSNDATFTFRLPISGIYSRRATIEKRGKKPGRSALVVALLDMLAEHLLAVAASNKAADTQDEASTQYSQATQTQQTPEDSLQLLELCYLFTRKTAIGYPSHALCKLLQWLVESVTEAATSRASRVIKISAGVKIYAKEMKKIKDFYRSLTILLNSTEDAELLVFSMAILARLVLSESMGSKLFSEKNVDQAFALVFSVLDGSWHDNTDESRSDTTTILHRRSLLQMPRNFGAARKVPEDFATIDNCLMTINLNGEAEQILVAAHFLASIVQLSHLFRKMLVKSLSDQDPTTSVKLAATTTAQLILKVIGDDIRSIRSLFESSENAERLNPSSLDDTMHH